MSSHRSGILPTGELQNLQNKGQIIFDHPPVNGQFQPASLDLRLGAVAYRIRASFLPGKEKKVIDKIDQLALHKIDLTEGAVLERGCVYVVPLLESLDLPEHLSAVANPKSSTGRLDIFTRVICDYAQEFDRILPGYQGPLYAEISPRTFSILVRQGSRLGQLRIRSGSAVLNDSELSKLHEEQTLVGNRPAFIDNGLTLSVDLCNTEDKDKPTNLIGYRAKHHTALIDVDKPNSYEIDEFWEPIPIARYKQLILDPEQFYILASREAVHVPPAYAAEMTPFDPLVGEFRVHYAGFFDPGFGNTDAGGAGSRAVLEVRSHEVPFVLEHGQIIGRLIYEPLTKEPENLYGAELNSNYQGQTLKLSKHFKAA